MKIEPIPLTELDVIGYADVLPQQKGPAIVPPVFRHRAQTDRCFVPPFRVSGTWLIGPQNISFDEAQELAREERLTLSAHFQRPAMPDHQLWLDEKAQLHYEPIGDAKRALQNIHLNCLNAAIAALRAGNIEKARQQAGIALAANDRALEPRALIAVCNVLLGETAQAKFMQKSAERAGLNAESFSLLVKNYMECISPETWKTTQVDLERTLEECQQLGAKVSVSFRFNEEEYQRFRPLLHEFHRADDRHGFVISCSGVEAILMSERETMQIAYDNAIAHVQQHHPINVLAVAAETMLYGTDEILGRINKDEAFVQKLGRLTRGQLRDKVIGPKLICA